MTIGDIYDDSMIGQKVTYTSNGQSDWIIFGKDEKENGYYKVLETEENAQNMIETPNNLKYVWGDDTEKYEYLVATTSQGIDDILAQFRNS